MNHKNFILKICLGTGLLFHSYFLQNSVASAVSLKSLSSNSNPKNILAADLVIDNDLTFISSSIDYLASILEEMKLENILVNKNLKIQIETYQQEQPKLWETLGSSLINLKFNQEIRSSDEEAVILLSQTNYNNIYQDVYDFDTELTNELTDNSRQTSRNLQENNIVSNKQKEIGFFSTVILGDTYTSPNSRTNNLSNINQGSSNPSAINTSGYGVQNSPLPSVNSISRNSSYLTSTDSSYYYNNQNQTQLYNNIDLSLKDIGKIKLNNIGSPSIEKTPEQIELEKKLAKQREQFQKRAEKLREKLRKEQQKRAEQRAKEREKRIKEQRKRFEKIARQQAKSQARSINSNP